MLSLSIQEKKSLPQKASDGLSDVGDDLSKAKGNADDMKKVTQISFVFLFQ
jgi:hypothetical protein